ncbi:MAG: helix-turn-helix transcriptional regulator [Elusimicrobium sp.]|uniref:Helix-turn-helix transcriptional regulator n=1 Tax=Candidatus Avelusimicrobium gallicola TaxID=2562704 RepID=A0A928DPL4_9BACT|nr:helix-turn-helix transcriptional regulator [Elusimicrobium sp.]
MKDLIKQLEEYRLKNRLTQNELAKKLGVSCVSVNKWLNEHTQPQKLQIYQIEQLVKTQEVNDK